MTLLFPPASRRPLVAVPARDEAERLPRLLESLSGQSWCVRGNRLTVVIVLNNCTDGSAEALSGLAPRHPQLDLVVRDVVLPPDQAHVGTARRLALDAALAAGAGGRVALLTTDADAQPEPNWIDANLAALDQGADVVGGRIIGDPGEEARLGPGFRRRVDRHLYYAELADRLADLLDPLPHDPLPRHADHTGASLAVRGEVYAALGGLPAVSFREDVAFVSRARAAGYALRHAPDVRVKVSARLVGRAPGGMADCLKAWIRDEAEGRPQRVEPVERLDARLRHRRALRTGTARPDSTIPPAPSSSWTQGWAFDPDTPAARVELWAADDLDARGEMDIETAIAALEALLRDGDAYVDAA